MTNIITEEDEGKLKFSALGSWAGYIYQGKCAAIETVRILIENENYDGFLSLDAYDDFAILDKDGNIVSFHQCKDVKGKNKYDDAFGLMQKAKIYFGARTLPGAKLFFHCNNAVETPSDIESYKFPNGNLYCEPGDILDNLLIILRLFYEKKSLKNICVEYASAMLAEIIERKVLAIQQEYFRKTEPLYAIAKADSKISFSEIKLILTSKETIAISKNNFCLYTKHYFLSCFSQIINNRKIFFEDMGREYPYENLCKILNKISCLDERSWEKCMQQISPDSEISIQNVLSAVPKDRSENLCKITEKIKSTDLVNEKLRYVPSSELVNSIALTGIECSSEDISYLCKKIYDNRQNLDCIYEVRWLTGLLSEKVDNIADVVQSITQVEAIDEEPANDEDSIFNPKKVGLLPVKDINDGNY